MMRPLNTALAAVLIASCSVACADESFADAELEAEAFRTRNTELPALNFGVCPTYLCGMNAGVAGSLSLNIDGLESLDEMIVFEVLDGEGEPVELELEQDRLYAIDGEGEHLTGAELVGIEILIQDIFTLELTSIYIEDFNPAGVSSPRLPDVVYPTYEFSFREHEEEDDPDVRTPLCGETPWNDEAVGIEPDTSEAITIRGEAFDWWGEPIPDFGEDPELDGTWLTIGCSGGAFAKKVLMGYDVNLEAEPRTNHAESETMMQMLTGRYCEGENHTVTGAKLYWQNHRGDFTVPEDAEIEAMWNQEGAACLNTPRYASRAAVELDCGTIPTCEGFDPKDYHLVSYLPSSDDQG